MNTLTSHAGNGVFELDGTSIPVGYEIEVTQEYAQAGGRHIPTLMSVSVVIDPCPFYINPNGILIDKSGNRWRVVLADAAGNGYINGPA